MSVDPGSRQSVEQTSPALLPQVRRQSRTVRGETWTFLENSLTGRQVRLNARAWSLVRQLDGRTRLDALIGNSQTPTLTLDEAADCLRALAGAGMLMVDPETDTERLLAQRQQHTATRRRQRAWNPLAVRIPLHDPDAWLTRLQPSCRFLFTRTTAVALSALLLMALAVAITFSDVIGRELETLAGNPGRWWLIALLYPVLKAVHEFAHALCIKHWNGDVHEVGVTFLVLMPVPHVDASAAAMFTERYQRMLVSAAGMLAEGALAALALLLWCLVEPGLVSDMAFATAVTGSVTTLLFNANPLLRFDGYYLLQDYLDMPNLATRATALYRYLFKRRVLGIIRANPPLMAAGERRWLLLYAPAAWVYRCVITLSIALFLAQHYLVIGVALAVLALGHLAVVPLFRGLQYLVRAPELDGKRRRASAITASLTLCMSVLFVAVPLPASTRAEGVVSVPEQAQVFAPESGEVLAVLADAGETVSEGQALITLSDPALEAELDATRAQRLALQISQQAVLHRQTDKAQQLRTDIRALERREQRLQDRIASLVIRSPRAGLFAPNPSVPLAGRHVERGDLLGYSLDTRDLRVTAVIRQQRLGEINHGVTRASVRLAERLHQRLPATLIRQTPAGSHRLPSPALADDGNGGIAVATSSLEGGSLQTLEPVFQIELRLPTHTVAAGIGGRAYVTLNHQPESLASRVWRGIRQLLLSRLTF